MQPLNYAILALFANDQEYDTNAIKIALEPLYHKHKAFTDAGIQESLMSAEKNGLLEESRITLDDSDQLLVFYRSTAYGKEMIAKYIP